MPEAEIQQQTIPTGNLNVRLDEGVRRATIAITLAVFFAICLLPLAAMYWRSFFPEGAFSFSSYREILYDDLLEAGGVTRKFSTATLLLRTLIIGLGSTFLGTFLGVIVAIAIVKIRSPLRLAIEALYPLSFLIPTYVAAVTWMWNTEAGAPINEFLRSLPEFVSSTILSVLGVSESGAIVRSQGYLWSIIVLSLCYFPIVTALTVRAFRGASKFEEEAGLMHLSSRFVLFGITLRRAAAPIGIGAIFVFLFAISNYAIPNLFLIQTFTSNVFAYYNRSDFAGATAASTPMLALTLIALFVFFRIDAKAKKASAANSAKVGRDEIGLRDLLGIPLLLGLLFALPAPSDMTNTPRIATGVAIAIVLAGVLALVHRSDTRKMSGALSFRRISSVVLLAFVLGVLYMSVRVPVGTLFDTWSAKPDIERSLLAADGEVSRLDVLMINTKRGLRDGSADIARTILLSVFTATFVTLFAGYLAGVTAEIDRRRRGFAGIRKRSRLIEVLVTLPFALPALTIGVAIIMLYNQPKPADGEFFLTAWLKDSGSWIYRSLAIVVIGATLRFLPFAYKPLLDAFRGQSFDQFEIARMFGVPFSARLHDIRFKEAWRSFVTSWMIVFILIAMELDLFLMIKPPGFSTLPDRIFNAVHFGRYGVVSGWCIIQIGIVLVPLVIVAILSIRSPARAKCQ
ncbi:MAG: ABC transporter permease subunit [Planctomycetes bacterium]|nr:ABC transporter permease subunit [Planctomycetota bacterium]